MFFHQFLHLFQRVFEQITRPRSRGINSKYHDLQMQNTFVHIYVSSRMSLLFVDNEIHVNSSEIREI